MAMEIKMNEAKYNARANYEECEILLVFGKAFTRKEFETNMKILWPDDFDDDSNDFPNDLIRDCIKELQIDYGINGWWTWRSENPVFVVGHQDLEILEELIEKKDKLRDIIPIIDWYYVPGFPVEDKHGWAVDAITMIELSKHTGSEEITSIPEVKKRPPGKIWNGFRAEFTGK